VKLPTASSLHRALACPASAVLPRAPSTTSEAAERGTAIHAYLEEWAQRGARPVAPPEYADTCHGIDLPAILAGRTICEVEAAYAFDVATGRARLIGYSLGRDYGPLSPTEIVGTADLVLIDSEGRGVILDWKTGQPQASAAVNPQLALLALCLSRYRGDPEVVVELVYLGEEGGYKVDRAVLDSLDLDSFAAQLREAVTLWRSPEAAQRVNPGDHCRYCPCFDSCPAQHQLARSFSSGLIDPAAVQSLTPEAAGAAWAKLEHYEALLAEIKKQLKERAHRQPLVLPTGERLGFVEKERRELSPEVAAQVVRERYGEEVAAQCVESSVSQAAIKRALTGKRGAWLEVVREVEARGGVKVNKYLALKELPRQLEGGGE
jgi:hypothetical protein